jgi:hypothetical protein
MMHHQEGELRAPAKHGTDGYAQEFHEDKGKQNCNIRVVQHAVESRVHVITKL